jgi:hypothetical protein
LRKDVFSIGTAEGLLELAAVVLAEAEPNVINFGQGLESLADKPIILAFMFKKGTDLNPENGDFLIEAIDSGSALELPFFVGSKHFGVKAVGAGILIARLAAAFVMLNKTVHSHLLKKSIKIF